RRCPHPRSHSVRSSLSQRGEGGAVLLQSLFVDEWFLNCILSHGHGKQIRAALADRSQDVIGFISPPHAPPNSPWSSHDERMTTWRSFSSLGRARGARAP